MTLTHEVLPDGVAVIRAAGRATVDTESSRDDWFDIIDKLIAAGHRRIVIDLKNVRYLDSTRLGWLIAAHVKIQREGGQSAFIVSERIEDLLRMVFGPEADRTFKVAPTIEEAAAALSG
jgi:anti-anti-sigma factor